MTTENKETPKTTGSHPAHDTFPVNAAALTLSEVNDQLQILEYIATNTPTGLTLGDRILLQKIQKQKKCLLAKAGAA
jgi:hypothetical protein